MDKKTKAKTRRKKGILGYPSDSKNKILFFVNSKNLDEESSGDDSSDSNYEPDQVDEPKVKRRRSTVVRKVADSCDDDDDTVTSKSHVSWSHQMPSEILLKIFSYAICKDGDITKIKNIANVCRLWRQICSDNLLWKHVNLSNKSKLIKYDSYIQYTIKNNKYKFTKYLNLSGLNELKIDDLESILKNSPCLLELDISDCKKLRSEAIKLVCDHCPKLISLNISSFSTEINFQFLNLLLEKIGCNLIKLNVSRNKLNKKVFGSLFTNCVNLQELDVSNCNSNGKFDLETFARQCKRMACFKMVDLSNNCYFEIPKLIDNENCFENMNEFHYVHYGNGFLLLNFITKFCKKSKDLAIFDICNYKSEDGLDTNMFDLIVTDKLEVLYLVNSVITDKDTRHLCNALKKWSNSLRVLELSWSKTSEENLDLICDCLIETKSRVKTINLIGTCISSTAAKKLMKKLKNLSEINLSSCRSIDRGMKRLLTVDDF